MRFSLKLVLPVALALVATASCDDDEEDVPQDPKNFSDLFVAPPFGVSACDKPDGKLSLQREIRLFNSGAADVGAYAKALQRYYARHSLTFFTRYEPKAVSIEYALDTDPDRLQRAASRALPGVDPNSELTPQQEEVLTIAVTNQVLSPLIRFAETYGRMGTQITNLVLLPKMILPGGEKEIMDGEGEIAGLAISPALLQQFALSDGDEGRIWRGVKFPQNFTPMMFLHRELLDAVAKKDEVARDLVVAHEFGHTGALVHVMDAHNLMLPSIGPGTYTCADALNAQQLNTMYATLSAGPAPQGQALQVGDNAPKRPMSGQYKEEIRSLLRGESKGIPSFLRPIFHTRVARAH